MGNKLILTNEYCLAWDIWEGHARTNPEKEAVIHWDVLGGSFRWTYGDLYQTALEVADYLVDKGVVAGEVCALIMKHNKYFYPIYMAISAVGAIPSVLAYPNARLHPDKFREGLTGMAQKSGLDWIITERELAETIQPIIHNPASTIKNSLFPLDITAVPQKQKPKLDLIMKMRAGTTAAMPFLLQHSSGTTGLQKAVVLSHRSVLGHVRRYAEAIHLTEEDKIINWLPLYHDMGLIAAFHMPLIWGIPSVQLDPFQWVAAPIVFFQAVAAEQATLTWLPNFAYTFMAERISDDLLPEVDLSSMRMFINCSEVVRGESHRKFLTRFERNGLRKESLAACYAMAETTFAVTQTNPGEEARQLAVDRKALAQKIVKPPTTNELAKNCVSSGKPITDCRINILGDAGQPLPDAQVGKIIVQSYSLFDGYRHNPEKTAQVLAEGWYQTGDIGFRHQGEYYIIGRGDDVIIAAGVNIFPEDIEEAVNKVPGVIPGRVVAFGVEDESLGTENTCVVVETMCQRAEEQESLRLAIKKAGMAIDVSIPLIYLVPPRWLIKSSSGKISRKANKERILSGKRKDENDL